MLERIRRLFSAAPKPAPSTPLAIDEAALLEPARVILSENRHEDALKVLEALVWEHPHLSEAHRLIGDLHQRLGELDDAQDSYTLALHFAPRLWPARYGLGLLEMQRGRFDVAISAFELAIEHGGDTAQVNNSLGAAHAERGAYEASVRYFRRAMELEPSFVEPYSNLGYVLFRELEQYDEGASLIAKAVGLNDQHTEASLNWAMVLQQRGEIESAVRVYEALLERDPNLAQARVNRGLIRLAQGDFRRGWIDYEARQAIAQFDAGALGGPAWEGSPLQGKRIIIYPEQGLGDQIMFAACVPEIARTAASTTLICHPKLEALFSRSFPGVIVVSQGAAATSLPQPDWSALIGSLPRFLRLEPEHFPLHAGYLQADSARVEHWRSRLAELPHTLKIGISWRGGASSTRRSLRSIPLLEWQPLLQQIHADFVSLQYTECSEELAEVERNLGVRVHHWREAIDDYDETAALVAALDLVISVQTAVVHLGGALGKPVWALIPAVPEWRYGLSGEVMPWYPSIRLFRQQRDERWHTVLEHVAAELARQPTSGMTSA